jgi:hypothetical protein
LLLAAAGSVQAAIILDPKSPGTDVHGIMAEKTKADSVNIDSIKSAAKTLASGMTQYYTGDRPGDVPGNLPDPYCIESPS